MRLFAALLLALTSAIAHAAAVWDIELHSLYSSDSFSLVGEFTTASRNTDSGQLITSFSGTVNGAAAHLGSSPAFLFDQMFYGPSDCPGCSIDDSFDNSGLLLQAGDNFINVFSGSSFPIADVLRGEDLDELLVDGSITFDRFTSTVPEPPAGLLYALGLCAILAARRMPAGVHWN